MKLRSLVPLPLLLVCWLSSPGLGSAAPLGLTLLDSPDIASFFIDVSYDAGSDLLEASGFALVLNDDGSDPGEDILNGIFELSATIDAAGELWGGTLLIQGTVPTLGFNSGTLLTGDLSDFGFSTSNDLLEFTFDVTGGDAAALYGSIGGTILAFTGFTGSFATDFDNLQGGQAGTGGGMSDGAAIPEPATAFLMLAGLLGLASRSRRTSHQGPRTGAPRRSHGDGI